MKISVRLAHLFGCVGNALKDAVFPKKCFSCGTFIRPDGPGRKQPPAPASSLLEASVTGGPPTDLTGLTGAFLCETCSRDFSPIASPICSQCGNLFKSREGDDHLCGDCITSPKHFRKARAFGVYDRTLMKLIHALKYRGKIQLAPALGRLLFKTFLAQWGPQAVDVIVPVPLHIRRLRTRGFNQSFLLIRYWHRMASAIHVDPWSVRIDGETLVRSKWTVPQTGLGRRKRMANIRKAFTITDPLRIRGQRILLVDDVYTTGATANECAKILLTGGAKCVDVLTLARAL